MSKTPIEHVLKIIKKDFSRDMYSLNGYQESAFCLDRSENVWLVYEAERGNKNALQEFDTELNACIELLNRMYYPDASKQIKKLLKSTSK